ncbi:hypothetical protein Fot_19744 [Forsythia ovata]|uniref:Uncharacterized protein n=1 Tax=Forsythia ovata TaxID=205694 RepID=A0ABD1VNX9_9LAMI
MKILVCARTWSAILCCSAAIPIRVKANASDLTASIDLSVLQERLTNMINLGVYLSLIYLLSGQGSIFITKVKMLFSALKRMHGRPNIVIDCKYFMSTLEVPCIYSLFIV